MCFQIKTVENYMDEYCFSPFGPTCWFCNLVFTKSKGKTAAAPMVAAIAPLTTLGNNLKQ